MFIDRSEPGHSHEDSPARQLPLGFDTQGRLPETVVLVFDSGNELIIHAMKARPQMLDLLPQLRRNLWAARRSLPIGIYTVDQLAAA